MLYVITKQTRSDGLTYWGFRLIDGFRQLPNWMRRKDAVASAIFHVRQRGLIR